MAQQAVGETDGQVQCWCCDAGRTPDAVVHLGNDPEVAVCLRCAHSLHQQAGTCCGAGRRQVLRRRWHTKPVIGPVLRWLGPRLP